MKRSFCQVMTCASLLVLATGARAGVLDTPLPMLGGEKTNLAYAASGVINAAGLSTLFSCTNTSSNDMMASVELFVKEGGSPCNDAAAVAVTLSPGESVMFSTGNNVQSSFFDTQPLTAVEMFLSLGSARIVTTGKGALCTAMVADMYNSPSTALAPLFLAPRGKVK